MPALRIDFRNIGGIEPAETGVGRRDEPAVVAARADVARAAQLMESFNCSHMTVRRDIAALEEAGFVYTVPGGVRIASHLNSEPSHQSKAVVEQPQKQAIARRAAEGLRSGMSIYLDAGTTMLSFVPHIVELSDMTVVTNDFQIVRELASATHVNVIHIGGQLDHKNLSSVGTLAAATGIRQSGIDLALAAVE